MRKGVFLLAISYALLIGCSSAVSLADNYAEDENYYDPTLPSPQFARTSMTLSQSYSEEELDDIWTNSSEVIVPENSSQGGILWNNTPSSGLSNTGFNSFNRPGSSFSFFGGTGSMINQWSPWNNPAWVLNNGWGMGYTYGPGYGWNNGWGWHDPFGWNNGWNNGWGYSYDPYRYGYGYNPYGWNNGWGWNNNSWSSTGGNSSGTGTTSTTTTNSTTRTNYGNRRPSKYTSTRGAGVSSGRNTGTTSGTTKSTGWRGIIEAANSFQQEAAAQQNVRSSVQTTSRRSSSNNAASRSYTRPTQRSSRTYDRSNTKSYNSKPSRTYDPGTSTSPSPSRSTRSQSSNSSSGRRR